MQKFSLMLRVVAAIILLQTLYFKFTGQPESVELFTKLGVEPWGRKFTGILELITSILLLIPSTVFIASILLISLMFGAVASHILVIGIESKGDGGQLFILACITLVCGLLVAIIHKKQALKIFNLFTKSKK